MTQQHPIGSPFSAASTAADVIRGIDLSGKNAIVTGGHSGLGIETEDVGIAGLVDAAVDNQRQLHALGGR